MDCSPPRLLCPWDSPGKNTGVGCHALLQGIFSAQGSNLGLTHCRQILYRLKHQGSLKYIHTAAAAAKSLQSYPTLCDPTDGSPPGSPVPGILQARTLEWVAIALSEICVLLYIKQITNRELLYDTGSYIQYLGITYNGREC